MDQQPPPPPAAATSADVAGAGHVVVVEPDRVTAGAWTAAGLVASAIALYGWNEGSQNAASAGLVALCVVATVWVGIQAVAPAMWTLHVDRTGVRGTMLGVHIDRSFQGLRAVDLSRRFAEPRLVLRGHTHRTIVLLPVGADLGPLQDLLAELEAEASRVGSPARTDTRPGGAA